MLVIPPRMNVHKFIDTAETTVRDFALDPSAVATENALMALNLALKLGIEITLPDGVQFAELEHLEYPTYFWFLVFGWEPCEIVTFLEKQTLPETVSPE